MKSLHCFKTFFSLFNLFFIFYNNWKGRSGVFRCPGRAHLELFARGKKSRNHLGYELERREMRWQWGGGGGDEASEGKKKKKRKR